MPGTKPPAHPITSAASVARLYWVILRRPRFAKLGLRLVGNIIRTYFAPQFIRRKGLKIVPLDTELDALVPFDHTWLACYMGFVRLWTGSLGWMHRRFGDRALPEMEGFVTGLESLFLEAYKVFRDLDSTVASRPGPRASLDSLVIHLADRNALCFPSLHVMIVRYNVRRVAAAVDRLKAPGEDFSGELAFLEERSLRIVESIIHVKQHSVSDIPAGLFLLNALGHSGNGRAGVSDEDLRFMERLFLESGKEAHGGRLRAFMLRLYHRLHQARDGGRDPHAVLLDFLGRYQEEVARLLKSQT
jgi:hypothetical protein